MFHNVIFQQLLNRDKTNKTPIGKQLLDVIKGRKALIGVGEITTLEHSKEAINKIGYDLIAVARAILTDPRFVYNIKNNKPVIEAMDYKNLDKQVIPKKMENYVGLVSN